jgi:outer membrane receptor for ferrienterochelin and colicin
MIETVEESIDDDADDQLKNLSLEEMMNLKISIASKSDESIREAPGIFTVITADNINRNHCRDLIDVFNMVPGLAIAQDVSDFALVSRGLYGFEGRTLIMLNGMQLTETRAANQK